MPSLSITIWTVRFDPRSGSTVVVAGSGSVPVLSAWAVAGSHSMATAVSVVITRNSNRVVFFRSFMGLVPLSCVVSWTLPG